MTPQGPQDNPLLNSPFHHPGEDTPGTIVTEPTAPVGRLPGQPIDTVKLQANLDAIAAACRTPGLTWQQCAAIQAGLPFATPGLAATAIRLANVPGSGFAAPGGMPRVPTAEELTLASANGRDYAKEILGLIGPAMG